MAVNAVRAGHFQGLGQGQVVGVFFVVDAGVKAEFVHHVITFVLATGDAHHPASTRFGQGAKGTAHRATGGADGEGLARLGVDDAHQAVPGGHARHAHRTQVMADRHMGGVHLAQHACGFGADHAVGLPSAHAHHLVAHREFGAAALHHFAHRAANHHAVERLWVGIALGVVHPAAHIGVQAEVVVFHQHFAVLQRGGV